TEEIFTINCESSLNWIENDLQNTHKQHSSDAQREISIEVLEAPRLQPSNKPDAYIACMTHMGSYLLSLDLWFVHSVIELRTNSEQTPEQNECGKTILKSDVANTETTLRRDGDHDNNVIRAAARGIIVQMTGGFNLARSYRFLVRSYRLPYSTL
uniref:Uncharacterized protein n=1 Tax=Glossina palpalis gambiensis TaxID=67801 RepID=A0A1B0BS85_9MUSC